MMGKVIMSGIVPTLKAPVNEIMAGDLAVGSTVKLMEGGIEVEYLVVNQGIPQHSSLYDSSCDGTWLLRKGLHKNTLVWNSTQKNDYASGEFNTWLNGDFFDSLGSVEQATVKQVKIPYNVGLGISTIKSGANGWVGKAFLLSAYEVGWTQSTSSYFPIDGACLDYFNGAATIDNKRIAYQNGGEYAGTWWLRSPFTQYSNTVTYVRTNGGWESAVPSNRLHARPALVIPKAALFNKSTLLLKGVA